MQIVGADPEGSVYSGGSGPSRIWSKGIGEDFWPTTYDPSIVDRVVEVSDAGSFLMARHVTREEGLLIGGIGRHRGVRGDRGGARAPAEAMVVVLIPDSGRNYLSKIFDDRWMIDHGFISVDGPTTRDVLEARASATCRRSCASIPTRPARAAIDMMRRLDVSQLVVAAPEPPLQPKEIEGSVRELELMNRVFHEPAVLDRPDRRRDDAAVAHGGYRRGRVGSGDDARRLPRSGGARRRPPVRGAVALRRARVPGRRSESDPW